jgi:hypothetical protein
MRLFYSDCIAAENQSRPELTSAVPYERLTRMPGGKTPYALGDCGSHRSIYRGACALWWGELLKSTAHPRILQMSVAQTDFFERKTFPTYLYYNPFAVARSVHVSAMPEGSRQYDLGAHAVLHTRGRGHLFLEIPALEARVVVQIPPGALREYPVFAMSAAKQNHALPAKRCRSDSEPVVRAIMTQSQCRPLGRWRSSSIAS